MPYQSAFTLLIIGGAFAATGAILMGLNKVETGKWRRETKIDYWTHTLAARDIYLKKQRKLQK
jgi:hypothetical protein